MNETGNQNGGAPQPQRPPQAGWQSGAYPPNQPPAPYRPTYPPQQPQQPMQQRPGPTYQQQQSRYAQTPYRYSASSGWQQPKPEEKYRWDFAEYEKLGGDKETGKGRSRGIVVFAVFVLCTLFVGLVAISGMQLWSSFVSASGQGTGGGELIAGEDDGYVAPDGAVISPGGEDVQLQISAREPPSAAGGETPPVGELMTTSQVAKAVRPAVVGVVNYVGGQFFEPYTEGSGIIMNAEGYIITNQHVIAGADALVIVTENGEEYEAQLIGQDARTDIAVLRIAADGLTPAEFGNSDMLEVGETVIAIGNPAGLELAGSVTQGIVSAVNREIRTPYYSMNYIQTDAAINPGNSGGALVNQYGQVIGINSAKIVAEGYEGICFAIPITEAKPIIDDLILNGRVTGRVLLGITGDPVSDVIARNYNVPAGVQIKSISNDALTEAGVMRGDIITHIDGERILDYNDIYAAIGGKSAGDEVTLSLFRQTTVTQRNEFEVTVPLIEDTGE